MKPTSIIVKELRNEYLDMKNNIAKAKFAEATLPLDETEKDLLHKQIIWMESYADILIERATYAKNKKGENYAI